MLLNHPIMHNTAPPLATHTEEVSIVPTLSPTNQAVSAGENPRGDRSREGQRLA